MKKILVLSAFVLGLFLACKKPASNIPNEFLNDAPTLPATAYDYAGRLNTFNQLRSQPLQSLNNDVATLGRVLFYERKLSANNMVSCGSCHEQSKAFTDGQRFSTGLAMAKTPRNTPMVCNTVLQSHFFWDGREDTLRNMVTKPILNHIEMGVSDLNLVVPELEATPYYATLFEKAFGDSKISSERIAMALEQFVNSIVSYQNRRDQELSHAPFAQLYTLDERVGRQLFMNSLPCASCHNSDDLQFGWSGSQFMNIGLDEHYTDKGAQFTGSTSEGFFKVPSLRNVALTAPYMHDGRFKTLEEVIDFYSKNIQAHPDLSFNLQSGWKGGIFFPTFMDDPEVNMLATVKTNSGIGKFGEPLRFELSDYQKKCLVAFLKTFTDVNLISNPMYSDPFRK